MKSPVGTGAVLMAGSVTSNRPFCLRLREFFKECARRTARGAVRANATGMEQSTLSPTQPDGIETAEAAGLRYVSDDEKGIRRRRCGRGFTYVHPGGKTVRDPATRTRIDELAIPPAWTEVWICRDAEGHLQVTGRDDMGRKQYLYHERWRTGRDRIKYARMAEFGERIPALRRKVERDLSLKGLERRRVIAGAIRMLDRGALRLGSDAYTAENESFGVTTLLKEHVTLNADGVSFRFPSKSGQERDVTFQDEPLARLVRALRRVEGERLLVYRTESGALAPVRPEQVNDYLREGLSCEATAKDFRTWAGTLEALHALMDAPDDADRPGTIIEAIDAAAERLGNRRPAARDYYVHPGLVRVFEQGRLVELVEGLGTPPSVAGLKMDERRLLALLPLLEEFAEEPNGGG